MPVLLLLLVPLVLVPPPLLAAAAAAVAAVVVNASLALIAVGRPSLSEHPDATRMPTRTSLLAASTGHRHGHPSVSSSGIVTVTGSGIVTGSSTVIGSGSGTPRTRTRTAGACVGRRWRTSTMGAHTMDASTAP